MKKLFFILAMITAICFSAAGQGVKISQLPALPTFNLDSCLFAVVYNGVTYKMPGYYLKGYGTDDSLAIIELVQIDSFHVNFCRRNGLCDTLVGVVGSPGSGGVESITGLNVDNTDPLHPIIYISTNSSLVGSGTPDDPLQVDFSSIPPGWNTTGNFLSGSEVIGSTNDKPIKFTVHGASAGSISSDGIGNENTFLGYSSGTALASGGANTAFGFYSLPIANSGNNNTAIGRAALIFNSGNANVAVGSGAGQSVLSGYNCTFLGTSSGVPAGGNYYSAIALGFECTAESYQFGLPDSINKWKSRGIAKRIQKAVLKDSTGNGDWVGMPGTISASYSGSQTAATSIVITLPITQLNNTYHVVATASNTLTAVLFYIDTKTTTSFTIHFASALTGTVAFDYILDP